jgi:tetratricopeptide (TPR) repeat protein
MRFVIACICLTTLLHSCTTSATRLVDTAVADTLLENYIAEERNAGIEKDLAFWKGRIDPSHPDLVNSTQYARQLTALFQATGHVKYLHEADSVLMAVAANFGFKDPGPYPALIRNALTRHQFKRADSLLQAAKLLGLRRYESASLSFDVYFEQGKIAPAKIALLQMVAGNDYGYQFRKARLKHYEGELDSALAAMETAVRIAGEQTMLWSTAVSNLADLYLHAGQVDKAYDQYRRSLRRDPSDLHSIMGIGWIALMHDGNDSLAERIFSWAASKTALPDPYLKLLAVAEWRNDHAAEKKFAVRFSEKASAPEYGGMYHKYLIFLNTGLLQEPTAANAYALSELSNRNTPQTKAWYAFSLMKAGDIQSAEKVYKEDINGRPLEGLEHYYMAQLTRSIGKGFAFGQYVKLAKENRYDLMPGMLQILDTLGQE